MWWRHIIDWLKFETRPSSLLNFGTAYWEMDSSHLKMAGRLVEVYNNVHYRQLATKLGGHSIGVLYIKNISKLKLC